MISIIAPSRGRPQQSFETTNKWILKAGMKDLEVIVSVDKSDPLFYHYTNAYEHSGFMVCVNETDNSVGAINLAASLSHGNILIVVSDDQEPASSWATKILRYTEGRQDWVLKVQDGIQPKIITQPIMDRIYYQRDGYIYYPGYEHLFCDREFTDVAHLRKRVITKNLRFLHRHYSVLKKQPDEQYKRSNLTYEQGKKLYLERKKINFGL